MGDASWRSSPEARTRVIFLGPPGAGKGTQAELLAGHLGVPRISTGDMLRDAMARRTPLGVQAAPLVENGQLVPDHLLTAIIQERLQAPDCARGYILDGYPRTLGQAESLAAMLQGEPEVLRVFDVEVPREELLSTRFSGPREFCSNSLSISPIHGRVPSVPSPSRLLN